LLCGITEETLAAGIPAHDDAVQVLGEDGIVRRFNDRGETKRKLFSPCPFGQVEDEIYRAYERSFRTVQGRRMRHVTNSSSVRTFDNRLHTADLALFLYRERHRTFGQRQFAAIGPKEFLGSAPLGLPDLRTASP